MDPIEALRIRGIGGGKKPTGNALPADVRVGKTYSSTQGYDLSGTLPVQSTVAQTVTPTTLNIVKSAGIYDGDITIQGDTNLVGSNIINGKSIFGVTGNVIAGTPWASGTATSGASQSWGGIGGSWNFASLTVSGLSFQPKRIVIAQISGANQYGATAFDADDTMAVGMAGYKVSVVGNINQTTAIGTVTSDPKISVTATGFTLPVYNANQQYKWYAYA